MNNTLYFMTKEINIKPEMGIYNVFRYLKYQPWFAISEFIDNSLQSFLNQNPNSNLRREKCKVIVSYEKEKILIMIIKKKGKNTS